MQRCSCCGATFFSWPVFESFHDHWTHLAAFSHLHIGGVIFPTTIFFSTDFAILNKENAGMNTMTQVCGMPIFPRKGLTPEGHCGLPQGHDGGCMINVTTKREQDTTKRLADELGDAWKPSRELSPSVDIHV